ncbi:hypothetical protein AOQ84DRAFT_133934 [Glonium stellatum]|uniref:Uncharacterized protein n=1 Tax=Glonium stellatum TaxID=574774 RepID=A0A8E2F9H4_9PEZI|nr:hypothetical protein AOQ84DRAFT_133934 [Glonium stellatum]
MVAIENPGVLSCKVDNGGCLSQHARTPSSELQARRHPCHLAARASRNGKRCDTYRLSILRYFAIPQSGHSDIRILQCFGLPIRHISFVQDRCLNSISTGWPTAYQRRQTLVGEKAEAGLGRAARALQFATPQHVFGGAQLVCQVFLSLCMGVNPQTPGLASLD